MVGRGRHGIDGALFPKVPVPFLSAVRASGAVELILRMGASSSSSTQPGGGELQNQDAISWTDADGPHRTE